MKQVGDTKTMDMLPTLKIRSGRPVGLIPAKSAAQRKADQRKRLADSGVRSLTVALDSSVLDALAKFVEFKDLTKSEVVERILRDRLLRKR